MDRADDGDFPEFSRESFMTFCRRTTTSTESSSGGTTRAGSERVLMYRMPLSRRGIPRIEAVAPGATKGLVGAEVFRWRWRTEHI